MTTPYRPSSLPLEAATQSLIPQRQAPTHISYGQVSQQRCSTPPTLINQTCPDAPDTPNADQDPQPTLQLTRPNPDSGNDDLHHIIIGSPNAVKATIKLLHVLRYVEGRRWTPLVAIQEQGLRITPNEGQVLSYLVRRQSSEPR